MEHIGQRIKRRREEIGLSQEELAPRERMVLNLLC